jgi:hypothetical protein
MMADPNLTKRTMPVKLNHRLVNIALSQYRAIQELRKRRQYARRNREKVKGLIREIKEEIENTTEDLLSSKVKKNRCSTTRDHCPACHHILTTYDFDIVYLDRSGEIPIPKKDIVYFLHNCEACGYIDEFN